MSALIIAAIVAAAGAAALLWAVLSVASAADDALADPDWPTTRDALGRATDQHREAHE